MVQSIDDALLHFPILLCDSQSSESESECSDTSSVPTIDKTLLCVQPVRLLGWASWGKPFLKCKTLFKGKIKSTLLNIYIYGRQFWFLNRQSYKIQTWGFHFKINRGSHKGFPSSGIFGSRDHGLPFTENMTQLRNFSISPLNSWSQPNCLVWCSRPSSVVKSFHVWAAWVPQ